jgi:hypothetical protein
MRTPKISLSALIAVLALGFGSMATAQGPFGNSFSKFGRHSGTGPSTGVPSRQSHVHCHACWKWVPAHFQTAWEKVWIPGRSRRVWVEPVYRTEFTSCGNPVQILVTPGHYQMIQEPGHFETVKKKVWVPGTWTYACGY